MVPSSPGTARARRAGPPRPEPGAGSAGPGAAQRRRLIGGTTWQVNSPHTIQFGAGDWITVVTNATGTFTGQMTLPDGTVIPPTGKAFDVEFGQTTKWGWRPAHRHLGVL